jgi:hypothetical protein
MLRLENMAEYEALKNRNTKTAPVTPSQSKFRAVMCEADGIKFRSKKERKRYLELCALRAAGEVKYFLRQTPFHLPGNTKYTSDFTVFWADGEVTHEDVKGYRTKEFIRAKKQVEALYPVRIIEPCNRINHTDLPGVKVRPRNLMSEPV